MTVDASPKRSSATVTLTAGATGNIGKKFPWHEKDGAIAAPSLLLLILIRNSRGRYAAD
jgi:hypothetical protein